MNNIEEQIKNIEKKIAKLQLTSNILLKFEKLKKMKSN